MPAVIIYTSPLMFSSLSGSVDHHNSGGSALDAVAFVPEFHPRYRPQLGALPWLLRMTAAELR